MPTSSKRNHSRAIFVAIAVFGLLVGAGVGDLTGPGGPTDPRPQLAEATVLFGQERALPEFALTAHDGQDFDRAAFADQWTLLFFGYTHCPDVCPITLDTLNTMLSHVTETKVRKQLKVVFVSVDPERDTLERLSMYVPFFNPEFVGATGSDTELKKLAAALGAVYLLGEPEADGSYTVDHSSRLLLIGPDARFTAVLSDRTAPSVLAGDLSTIIDAYASGT
jgi:protein SCO1/2